MLRGINKITALLAAKIIKVMNPSKGKHIWVMGGSVGKRYIDNGAALHQYILKNHPEIDVYWIINRNSPDVAKAKKEGPILYRESFKGNLYTLLAKVLICTHELPFDVSGYGKSRYKEAVKVFISHGIEGLKRKTPEQAKVHQIYDLSVSVSDIEKRIKVNEWGLDEKKVCITGLPRYDLLEKHREKKKEEVKNILYMPTWRKVCRETFKKPLYRITEEELEEFKRSDYYRYTQNLIRHPRLLGLLKKKGIRMHLFFHPNTNEFMKEIIDLPESPEIRVFSIQEGVHKNIIESDMLITDYSSVCWDFLYLDKPVIFYQFDQEEYLEETGSHLKLPDELFGPASYNPEETIEKIEEIIEKDNYVQSRKRARDKFFKYKDNKNCKRVMDCILSLKRGNFPS